MSFGPDQLCSFIPRAVRNGMFPAVFRIWMVVGAGAGLVPVSASDLTAATSHALQDATRLKLAQSEGPEAGGLPPAPSYIPGTAITPDKEVPTVEPAPRKSAEGVRRPEARETVREAQPPEAAVPPVVASAAAPAGPDVVKPREVRTDDPVWQKVVPLLPEPGEFAVIPGSAIAPVLVRKGEFDFCADIKCHRSSAVLGAWNGGAFDARRGEFRVHGGGHADYGGNEVYVFDFAALRWTRETDPQPLTGPFLRDSDGDGQNDACPAPASGPPATHTYGGFVYVPKIDRYWLFGTVEYCANGMGGSSAWEYDAHSKTWTAMPELDPYARFARAVVDPRSGNVIVRGGGDSSWREIDVETRKVVRQSQGDPYYMLSDGPAVFDAKNGWLYALAKGGKTDRLLAFEWPQTGDVTFNKGASARVAASWPKSNKKAWGLAQHASGLLVMWDGNDQILVVDPATGNSFEPEHRGDSYVSLGDTAKARKVYSKWAYVAEIDAFVGVTKPDLGIVLYRLGRIEAGARQLPDGAVQLADTPRPASAAQTEEDAPARSARRAAVVQATKGAVIASGSPPNDNGFQIPLEIRDAAAWNEVCATAILCDPMGEGEVLYRGQVVESGPPKRGRYWRSIGHKMELPDSQIAMPDPVVGGLRFYFPSNSAAGAAGNFKTNFSPDMSFQVGPASAGAPAQEVYIQFQVRYSCSFIWTDCDPDSPNYRKERRCYAARGGDGCTSSKIALISTGDREDFRADACMRIQTAINHHEDHHLHAFHRCPRARGFGEALPKVGGRYQGNAQPNGLYYCPRILDDRTISRWNNSADSCFRLVDEKWITIQVRLRFGGWQHKPKKSDPRLSHASIWGAIEDQADGNQRLIIDNDFYATQPEGPEDFVGKIWLMPHLYRKDPKETHPPFHVWYRNLVISQSLIPNPR